MTSDLHIVLLHGAGGHSWSLSPIKIMLKMKGYRNIHVIDYDFTTTIDRCIESVHNQLLEKANIKKDSIIVIGQSLGGVVGMNLHKKEWDVKKLIAIVSPLKGASIIDILDNKIPSIYNMIFHRQVYNELRITKDHIIKPPHDCFTISTSWPFTNFDGCVFKHEAVVEEDKHIHIPCSDHRLIFASPRLMYHLNKLL